MIGGWVAAANGTYLRDGENAGKPKFAQVDGVNFIIYREEGVFSEPSWYISENPSDTSVYGATGDTMMPPEESTSWFNIMGVGALPTLVYQY